MGGGEAVFPERYGKPAAVQLSLPRLIGLNTFTRRSGLTQRILCSDRPGRRSHHRKCQSGDSSPAIQNDVTPIVGLGGDEEPLGRPFFGQLVAGLGPPIRAL